ncbi:hypothetical protein B296_00055155 [Ensete ventricosum]|uniref:Uncharacterized protein n=1 Tax=Ensete ventricosum TaxID=4639 RepID=A0A426Y0Z0_ENSVE|nr:hypothetical protein B296_00055155 [Ensete ventricosum]
MYCGSFHSERSRGNRRKKCKKKKEERRKVAVDTEDEEDKIKYWRGGMQQTAVERRCREGDGLVSHKT